MPGGVAGVQPIMAAPYADGRLPIRYSAELSFIRKNYPPCNLDVYAAEVLGLVFNAC